MRTGTDLIRTMLFTIALALALGSAASAAQLFHGGTRSATVQVDDRSRSAHNDDGEDRDGEDEDDASGDKDEQGQHGQRHPEAGVEGQSPGSLQGSRWQER